MPKSVDRAFLVAAILVSLNPLLGCGQILSGRTEVTVLDSEPHPIDGVDYGPVPSNYDRMVEDYIEFKYDLEWDIHAKESVGPFEGALLRTPAFGEPETLYGYEVHVWFSNDVHYLVLIRDGEVVESVDCGEMSGGFPLLEVLLNSHYRPRCAP